VILNFKIILFFSLIILGYYNFIQEYENLNIKNIKIVKTKKIFINNIKEEDKSKKTEVEIFDKNTKNTKKPTKDIDYFNITELQVKKGQTFSSILKKYNFSNKRIFEINDEVNKFFDLRKLKVNQKITFYGDINKEIKKIEIDIDLDTILEISLNKLIKVKKINLEKIFYNESKEFMILNSLYSDGIKNDLSADILIKLIKLFSFDLDFQRDIKANTIVSVSYSISEIVKNNKIEYNDINYALISINNKKLEYFKFLTDDGYIDYFNRDGKNVKKSILKTPLDGARLSSNFGMRKHPISGYNKMHKGVDFAAPSGTPIYAGGNGVVEFIGNNGGYGKYIRIRHNNEYKTAYAHLSGYKKGISKGVRVNQGDIIGYVGSTGNSTGPHLHYEILYQNKHINPLKLKLPSGKILAGKELKRFKDEYKKIYADHLNLLYE
tara:strand:- start:3196 stop:4503 length:1308 start_codon:yes stop_codon:yes gene_type:complete